MANTEDFTDLDFDAGSSEFNFDDIGSMDFGDGERKPSPWSPVEILKSAVKPENLRDAGRILNRKGIGKGYADAIEGIDNAKYMGRDLYDSTYESMRGDIESTKNVLRQLSKGIAENAGSFLPEWVTNRLLEFSKKPDDGWSSDYIDPTEAAIQSATMSVFGKYAATGEEQLKHSVESSAQIQASTDGLREDTRKGLGNLSENISKLVAYQDNVTLNYHKKTMEIQLRTFFETKELVKVTKANAVTTAEKLSAIQKNTSLPDFAKLTLSENSSLLLQNKLIGGMQDRFLGYFSGTSDKIKKAIGRSINDAIGPLLGMFGSMDGQVDMLFDKDSNISIPEMVRDQILQLIMTQGVELAADKVITPRMKEAARNRGVSEEEVLTFDKRLEYITGTFGGNIEDIATGRSNKIPLGFQEITNKVPKFVKTIISKFAPRDVVDVRSNQVLITSKDLASGKLTDVLSGKKVKSFKDITGPVVDDYGLEVVDAEQYKNIKEVQRKYADDTASQTNMFADFIREYYDKPKNAYATPKALLDNATAGTEFDLMTRRSIVEIIPGFLSRILEQVTTLATGKPAERIRYDASVEGFVGDKELFTNLDKKLFPEGSIQQRRKEVHDIVAKMDKENKLTDEEKSALVDQMLDDFDAGASTWNITRYNDTSNVRMQNYELGRSIAEKLSSYQHTGVEDLALDKQWKGLRRLDADIRKELERYAATGDTEKLREMNLLVRKNGRLVVNNEYIRQRERGVDEKKRGPGEGGNIPPSPPSGGPIPSPFSGSGERWDDDSMDQMEDLLGPIGGPIGPGSSVDVEGPANRPTVEDEWAAAMEEDERERASAAGRLTSDAYTEADDYDEWAEALGQNRADYSPLSGIQSTSEAYLAKDNSTLQMVSDKLIDYKKEFSRKYRIFKDKLMGTSGRTAVTALDREISILLADVKYKKDIDKIKDLINDSKSLTSKKKEELLKQVDDFTQTDLYKRGVAEIESLVAKVKETETFKSAKGKYDEVVASDEVQGALAKATELKDQVSEKAKEKLSEVQEMLAERGITLDTVANTTVGEAVTKGKKVLRSVVNKAAAAVESKTGEEEAPAENTSVLNKAVNKVRTVVNSAANTLKTNTATPAVEEVEEEDEWTEALRGADEVIAGSFNDRDTAESLAERGVRVDNEASTLTAQLESEEMDSLTADRGSIAPTSPGGPRPAVSIGGFEGARPQRPGLKPLAPRFKINRKKNIDVDRSLPSNSAEGEEKDYLQTAHVEAPIAVQEVQGEGATAPKSSMLDEAREKATEIASSVAAGVTSAIQNAISPSGDEPKASLFRRMVNRAKTGINSVFGKTKTTTEPEKPEAPESVEKATEETVQKKTTETTEAPEEKKALTPKISDMIGAADADPMYALVDTGFSAVIDTINKNFTATNTILGQLSGAEAGPTGGLSMLASGAFKTFKSASAGAFGLLKTYYDGLSKIAGPVGRVIGGTIGGVAGGLVGGAARGFRFAMGKRVNLHLPGREDPVIFARDLDDGRYVNKEDGKNIYEAKDITGEVLDENGDTYLTAEQASQLTDRTGRPATTGMGSLFKNLGRLWGAQTRMIGRILTAPMRLAQAANNFLYRITDVYVRGEEKPRLLAVVMRNGGYISSATGVPIYDIRKMDSDIKDLNGNVVLSTADAAAGLCDRFGASLAVSNIRRFLSTLYRPTKALVTKAVGLAKRFAEFNLDVGKKVLGGVAKGAGAVLGGATDAIGGAMGYQKIGLGSVGGSDGSNSIVSGILAQQLIYQRRIYEFLTTGKIVESPAVEEVDEEDTAEAESTPEMSAEEAATVNAVKKEAAASKKTKARGKGKTAGERTIEDVDVAMLSELKRIQKSLLGAAAEEEEEDKEEEQEDKEEKLKEEERAEGLVDADNDGREDDQLGDMDADGLRDNSWQAIARRKEKEKEAAAASKTDQTKEKEKEPEKKDGGIMSWLMPLVGGIGNKISGLWDTLKDIGAAIAAYFAWKKSDDIADDVLGEGDIDIDTEGDDDDNRRRRRRRGGRGGRGGGNRGGGRGGRGWIRGAVDKVKGVFNRRAPTPGGAAARTGIKAVLSRGASMAAQVATRAIPLASAAVSGTAAALGTSALVAGAALAAGVVAVGAIGYGGYKLYKHLKYTADLEPLEGLRYLQYGIDINNKDAIPAIRKLEEAVIDEMTGSGVSAAPGNDPAYYFNEHAEDFNRSVDSQEDGEQWGYWFAKRFCPILFTHIRNLHTVDDDADIDDIDDDLEAKDKIIFIKKVLFTQKDAAAGVDPYSQTVSPFPNIPLIANKEIINAYGKKLIEGLIGKVDLDEVSPADIMKKAGATLEADAKKKTEGGVEYKSTVGEWKPKRGPSLFGALLNPVAALTLATENRTNLGFFDYVFSPLDSIKMVSQSHSFYERFESRVLPLEGLRFIHYGSSLEDYEFMAKIRILEELVMEYTTFNGSVPMINKDPNYFFDEMYKLFGLSSSESDQLEWKGWYIKRFLPVFIKHVGTLKSLDKEVQLFDIDDDLANHLKKDFVGLVTIHPASKEFEVHPYQIAYRPLFGHGIITDLGIITAYTGLLLKAIAVPKDLDAFDPKMLPQEIEKDPSITMKVYRAREDVNGLQSLRERAGRNVAKTEGTGGRGANGAGEMPEGVKPLTPEQLQGAFISPVANGVVTSKFGPRLHPIKKVMKPHNGLDFAGKTGDPIRAIQDGMVFKQEKSPSYGNIVYVKHTDKTTSRYAHLHKFPAGQTVGTEVKKGQVIGFMGSTGASTGPHLHFEMRDGVAQDARPIDPLKKIDPSTLAGGKSIAKPEPKEDKTYVDGPPVETADDKAAPAVASIPKLSGDAPIKPALSTEEVNKTTQSMVSATAKPAEPTVVQVNGGKDEKILSDILKTQDEGTTIAAEQRNKQLEAQEALLKKMDTLIGVMSASEKPKATTAPPPPPKKETMVAAAPAFPKTKTTNSVMDYGH